MNPSSAQPAASTRSPRVAVGAFMLESNSHAPVATREEFAAKYYLCDAAFEHDWRQAAPHAPATVRGFIASMDAAGPWQAVPLLGADAGASGCIDQGFFEEVLEGLCKRLAAAGPVDAVFLSLHGAAIATAEVDPEGLLLERVRAIVGPGVPVVGTLDLHGNIVARMVDNADVLISYRTNPHVDCAARGADAAAVLREMVGGMRSAAAFVKLPMTPPSVTQNTASGPYADLIAYGQSRIDADVIDVSILSGFTLGDTPRNGMSVIVSTRGQPAKGRAIARDIALKAWSERTRWLPRLTSLADATAKALACNADAARAPLLFADVADNAGGGGRANTIWILQAFVQAGVQDALLGLFVDPALAAEAHQRGVGASWSAQFNRDEPHPLSGRMEHAVTVLALHDGNCVGRRGVAQGQSLMLGRSALLQVGGVRVVVVTNRHQCKDPVFFEIFGVDIAQARCVVVKSRGHFRAGFDQLFPDEHIIEVDVPGLTTPVLSQVPWRHMPRPMFPLDPEMTWEPAPL